MKKNLNLSFILWVLSLLSCSQDPKNAFSASESRVDSIQLENFDLTFDNSTKKDSSVYWINASYIDCLNSELSVCDCLSKNQFILLFIDSLNNKMILESSIHFGMETSSDYDIFQDSLSTTNIAFANKWMPGDSGRFKLLNSYIVLSYKNETIRFNKTTLKTLDAPKTSKAIYSRSSDMSKQLAVLNSTSLLNYPFTSKTDSSYIFKSFQHLNSLIKENKVFINCSDDFFYNSLRIQDSVNEYYHLEYSGDFINLYKEGKDGRERGEKVNTSNMKRQIFFRSK